MHLDLHNCARYRDFHWQADGSVQGLSLAPDPLLRPNTRDLRAKARQCSEMALYRGHPQLRFVDECGQTVELRSPLRLAPVTPEVLTLSCTAPAQRLRVNSWLLASSAAP